MNVVQRYTWCDALIEARTLGVIAEGEFSTAMKLARAIEWTPSGKRKGQPSGLYWKNETAAEVVGISRASLFRHIKILKAQGFLVLSQGNLLPVLPGNLSEISDAFTSRTEAITAKWKAIKDESLRDTEKSLTETTESPADTEKSLTDNPYSDNTYSEDVDSEDSYSDGGGTDSISSNKELDEPVSPNEELQTVPVNTEEKFRQSLTETGPYSAYRNEPQVDTGKFTGLALADIGAAVARAASILNEDSRSPEWRKVYDLAAQKDFEPSITKADHRVNLACQSFAPKVGAEW